MKIENFKLKIVLLVLIFFGAFLRLYNLNWGAPYNFHPDERNIATSIAQLQFPNQMNPQFFAYGSLPIYAIYFTGVVVNSIQYPISNIQLPISNVSFEKAIIISRFYSALFSVLLIPLLFVIARRMTTKQSHVVMEKLMGLPRFGMHQTVRPFTRNDAAGFFAGFLIATSVGFIQFAHFGTFEMWLTLFSVLLFWLCLQKMTTKTVVCMGVVFGILVATKVSSLAIFPIPILAIIIHQFRYKQHHAVIPAKAGIQERYGSRIKSGMIIIKQTLLFTILSSSVYIISNPFVFFDTSSFLSSMRYESSVALGTLPVFYTGEFFNAIPVLFQLQNVYPFLLNPLITFLFIPSFLYVLYKMVKTKSFPLLILNSFFLILLLSQAFLFVKWTRYMVPTLPFVYLIVVIALTDLLNNYSSSERRELRSSNATMQQASNYDSSRQARTISYLAIIFTCSIFAFSYFITAFIQPDTRLEAAKYVQKHIPSNAQTLSEVYDLGTMPFPHIELFNFYELDSNPEKTQELQTKLATSEYIILPSQRLLKIRLNNPKQFPIGHDFYQSLMNGTLGYTKIYQTPCDIFCKITYLGDPASRYEETANVFERPTVYIFKKM